MVSMIMLRRALGRQVAADVLKLSSQPIALHSSRVLQILSRTSTTSPSRTIPQLVRSYATTRTKSTTKKKATPKRKATKKTTKKKQPAKKKALLRRPKAPKKPLTAEELKKQKVIKLKQKALLEGPKSLPSTAYQVYVAQSIKSGQGQSAPTQMAEASRRWKSLPPSETQRYERIASDNKSANQDAYIRWVKQYTPDQVNEANNARRQLSQIAKEPKPVGGARRLVGRTIPPIKDDRLVKQPLTAYALFFKDRMVSGDLTGPVPERARIIGREWKSMTASQAQTYHEQHKALTRSYIEDYNRTYQKRKTSARA